MKGFGNIQSYCEAGNEVTMKIYLYGEKGFHTLHLRKEEFQKVFPDGCTVGQEILASINWKETKIAPAPHDWLSAKDDGEDDSEVVYDYHNDFV